MLSVPERKPPLKVFSKKELKRARIDRKHRKAAKSTMTEDLGTHYQNFTLQYPVNIQLEKTLIPKLKSEHHQPLHLGRVINIILYKDSNKIYGFKRYELRFDPDSTKGRNYIGEFEGADLLKLAYDILKYFNAIHIQYSTGRVLLRGEVKKYIRETILRKAPKIIETAPKQDAVLHLKHGNYNYNIIRKLRNVLEKISG